jgi:hypothetical protein
MLSCPATFCPRTSTKRPPLKKRRRRRKDKGVGYKPRDGSPESVN